MIKNYKKIIIKINLTLTLTLDFMKIIFKAANKKQPSLKNYQNTIWADVVSNLWLTAYLSNALDKWATT